MLGQINSNITILTGQVLVLSQMLCCFRETNCWPRHSTPSGGQSHVLPSSSFLSPRPPSQSIVSKELKRHVSTLESFSSAGEGKTLVGTQAEEKTLSHFFLNRSAGSMTSESGSLQKREKQMKERNTYCRNVEPAQKDVEPAWLCAGVKPVD
ncbi:hypothetical protein Q8A67_018815 [Cirrhinus molitorella]|uniref:Uncharacterized protein n=1 Tax=Cirrhinus molitorella TaxID=172907 RepID=A0AA88TGG1_9TELE|nr:hypothetical protein Q8A67_018815 [Cirrhinus molitorella]